MRRLAILPLLAAAIFATGCGIGESDAVTVPDNQTSQSDALKRPTDRGPAPQWPETNCSKLDVTPSGRGTGDCTDELDTRTRGVKPLANSTIDGFSVRVVGVMSPYSIPDLPEEEPTGQFVRIDLQITNKTNVAKGFTQHPMSLEIDKKSFSPDDDAMILIEDAQPLLLGKELQPETPTTVAVLFDISPSYADRAAKNGSLSVYDASPAKDEAQITLFRLGTPS